MKAITLLVLSLILISAPAALADDTFSYVGTPFTAGHGNEAVTEISGFLTLSGPLPANAFFMTVVPSDFSFGDGFFNWTSQNVTQPIFEFSTDSNGNIVGWQVDLTSFEFIQPNVEDFIFNLISSWDQGVGQDSTQATRIFNFGSDYFATSGVAGSWTSTETAATPEPPTYLLFLSGIGLILVVSLKRRTATRSRGQVLSALEDSCSR